MNTQNILAPEPEASFKLVSKWAISYVALTFLISYAAKYFLNVFLARWLTPAQYGDYAVAIRVLTFCAPMMVALANNLNMRKLSLYVGINFLKNAKPQQRWHLKLAIASFLLAIGFAAGLTLILFFLDIMDLYHFPGYHLGVYAIWIVPGLAVVIAISSLFMISKKLRYSVALINLIKYAVLLIAVVMLGLIIKEFSHIHLWITLVIALMVVAAVQIILMLRKLPDTLLDTENQTAAAETESDFKSNMRNLFTISFMLAAMNAIDIVMVEIAGNNESMTGVYAAILIIANIMWVVDSITVSIFNPLLNNYKRRHDNPLLKRHLRSAQLSKLIWLAACWFLLFFFGYALLEFFGKAFTMGYIPLIILISGYVPMIFMGFSPHLLTKMGFSKIRNRILIWGIGITIIAEAIFIPEFGLIGAASAAVGGHLFVYGMSTYWVRRLRKL